MLPLLLTSRTRYAEPDCRAAAHGFVLEHAYSGRGGKPSGLRLKDHGGVEPQAAPSLGGLGRAHFCERDTDFRQNTRDQARGLLGPMIDSTCEVEKLRLRFLLEQAAQIER